jgi:hypothetical protein
MLVNQLLTKPLKPIKPIKPIKKNNVENLSHIIDPECSLKFIEDSDIKLYFIGDNFSTTILIFNSFSFFRVL